MYHIGESWPLAYIQIIWHMDGKGKIFQEQLATRMLGVLSQYSDLSKWMIHSVGEPQSHGENLFFNNLRIYKQLASGSNCFFFYRIFHSSQIFQVRFVWFDLGSCLEFTGIIFVQQRKDESFVVSFSLLNVSSAGCRDSHQTGSVSIWPLDFVERDFQCCIGHRIRFCPCQMKCTDGIASWHGRSSM